MTEELLSLPVPQVPAGATGVAWLRAHVVRFSNGPDHTRRRALTTKLLENVTATTLDELAAALNLPGALPDIATIAPAYQPHEQITAEADAAVERLAPGKTEEAAARIGLLVQAWAATHELADHLRTSNPAPPVPITRRATESGVIEVSLDDHPFGHGPHACPGRTIATKIAKNMAFRALHHQTEPLVLPNAWDHTSAAALHAAGFPAIGTTSLGVAAAHGIPDGMGQAGAQAIALARLLADLPCPVTADLESGFGATPEELAETVAGLGVAGINLEDGRPHGLAAPEEQAKLIEAVKRRAPGVFVNARVDTHWQGTAIDETRDRAKRYVDAGADGIFVPGVTEPHDIEKLAGLAPLNVLAQQRTPKELGDLGVKRISTGSLLFRAALRHTVATARAVRDGQPAGAAFSYAEVQALISPGTRSDAG
ncbi:isocitrate lyase/phosphoenolpyruvate mutase family protein [Lentzea sp. BCCO 10_0856]|uniref:Isocitrate lyase/phosphoenolpyruvate mutase family protein n=1 Tax=Lentzea miocenica TaxID=3095431 RepID=A0ABU4T9D9_9PSEU|nr:isocitrate lyase/phosphoenolpyruvate mutase family protein [Lentzea sp. BCCO 10_0856]MDX8034538.1 isocitrate lyase/phosphoenolpyruvate mutase family protein [Lentzea sp. BCCO 10_0856]